MPGRYAATRDGRDVIGRSVVNCVYFYRLDVPGYRDVKKAVVMRQAEEKRSRRGGAVMSRAALFS